ncbi:hypothetical protein AB0K21_21830 [Streptosporangium sp. NPDC049248]|uniref:hypothetical protein n=1 Tax=Streptosporangium sp. NPDC049248 TaxID=3155651 RepID=UPI0034276B44
MATESEPRTLTDWRGNSYTVGTRVFYPRMSGRSCEIQEGTVLDIWDAVYDFDKFRWVHFDPDNPRHQKISGRDRVTKVKVQPTGRGSRDFYRSNKQHKKDNDGKLLYGDDGWPVMEDADAKPVTLAIIENITVVCTHEDGGR